MKIFETIQYAQNGGYPVNNGEGFDHGDDIYIIKKRELIALLYRITPNDSKTKIEIDKILKEDHFIFRGTDLPERIT